MTKLIFTSAVFSATSTPFVLLASSLVIAVLVFVLFTRYLSNSTSKDTSPKDEQPTTDPASSSAAHASEDRRSRKKLPDKKSQRFSKSSFAHPWLLTVLKAHSGSVLDLDFSGNKKHLATCAEDRTVMLWHVKDFAQKDHKFLRVNVDFDYATRVRWSPDSKAFVVCRHTNLDLQVFKVNKKPDGSLGGAQCSSTFPTKLTEDIVGMGIASTGKFLMTCTANNALTIWSLKGELLTSIDTHQVNAYYACVSPCGRFVASCGFTSDVKVWRVVFNKGGDFKEVVRAFELKGHTAGVDSFAFSDDSSRMASISKDKTWKLWDTKVEFDKGQEPYLLLTVPCHLRGGGPVILSLSPDGRVVAIANGTAVRLYSGISGSEERIIDNEGPIQCLTFDPFSKYLLVATDKHVRVFHNAVGYKITIQELEERKKSATNPSMKERIQQQILEARSSLDAIGES